MKHTATFTIPHEMQPHCNGAKDFHFSSVRMHEGQITVKYPFTLYIFGKETYHTFQCIFQTKCRHHALFTSYWWNNHSIHCVGAHSMELLIYLHLLNDCDQIGVLSGTVLEPISNIENFYETSKKNLCIHLLTEFECIQWSFFLGLQSRIKLSQQEWKMDPNKIKWK